MKSLGRRLVLVILALQLVQNAAGRNRRDDYLSSEFELSNERNDRTNGQIPPRRNQPESEDWPRERPMIQGALNHKLRVVSSAVQSIPAIVMSLMPDVFLSQRRHHNPYSNTNPYSPSTSSVVYPSSGAYNTNVRQPSHSAAYNPNPGFNRPPTQNQPGSPSFGSHPSQFSSGVTLRDGTKIPVAAGGSAPPPNHVPNRELFPIENFHLIDPGNPNNIQPPQEQSGNSPSQIPVASGGSAPPPSHDPNHELFVIDNFGSIDPGNPNNYQPSKGQSSVFSSQPQIPVATGGSVPPASYVPSNVPYVIENFHTIDPVNPNNRPPNGFSGSFPSLSTGNNGGSNNNFSPPGFRNPAPALPSQNSNHFSPGTNYPSQVSNNFGSSNNFPSDLGNSPSLQSSNGGNIHNRNDIFTVVNGIQEFTLDIISTFRALQHRGNIVFSPVSITSLLSLLTLGTTGTSKQEIETALSLPNEGSSDNNHNQYKMILRRLNYVSQGMNISTASRLFLEENIEVFGSFTSKAFDYYSCNVSLENFRGRPTQTMKRINRWVAHNTQGKIKDFLTSPLSPNTIFVAANTIYFSGHWETPFPEYFTEERDFDTGREVMKFPMMTNVLEAPHYYSSVLNVNVVSLPYYGGEFAMIVILPRETPQQKSIKKLERTLDTFYIESLISNMTRTSVSISLPKMRMSMKMSLPESLTQLNIKSIFSPVTADFSELTSHRPVYVSDFLHEAILEVSEVGTVGAAVSATSFDRSGGYIRININKPAIIFIRDLQTGLPLFWARLVKPDRI